MHALTKKHPAVNIPSTHSTYSCDNTPNNSTSTSSPGSWPTQNSELCTGTLLRICERYTKPSGNSRENWTACKLAFWSTWIVGWESWYYTDYNHWLPTCIVIHLNRGMVILMLYWLSNCLRCEWESCHQNASERTASDANSWPQN